MAQPAAAAVDAQFPVNLLVRQNDVYWYNVMRIYNCVSTRHIDWRTDLRCIRHATNAQIQRIREDYRRKHMA